MDWITLTPLFAAMFGLIVVSAFFSASEAALFYLRERDLRMMSRGNARQQLVASLLAKPEQLLTAILFWNLLMNMSTFAITSLIAFRLESAGQTASAITFSILSVFVIIFFAEMLPKSLAVLTPKSFAAWCAGPIQLAVRVLDPLFPFLSTSNLISLRLIWPGFKPEPYLALSDLERAVKMSGTEETLDPSEQRALENIVSLADQRVDEWMKPSNSVPLFSPPVQVEQLREKPIESSYVMISEPDSDEVAKAIWLPGVANHRQKRIDLLADPVVYVPWCTSVAAVVERLAREKLQVAAVVNEHGQTIGVVTIDDILDTIFAKSQEQGQESGNEQPKIGRISDDEWSVDGSTSLRLLARELGLSLPESRNVTVRGQIQEVLQRLAKTGDRCEWGGLEWTVVEASQRTKMRVSVRRLREEER